MSSLFVLFAIGRNIEKDLKWGKWAGTGESHNTTSPALPCQCEDWGVCFMLFLFLSIFRKIQFTLEECGWWLIPFWTEMTVRAVRIVVEWPKVGWISHLWQVWERSGRPKSLGTPIPSWRRVTLQGGTRIAFGKWDTVGWDAGAEETEEIMQTADMLSHTKSVEPRKLTFPKLSETQSI